MLFKKGKQIVFGDDLEIIKKIPKGVWLLTSDDSQTSFKVESQPDFTLPKTLYGDTTEIYERFLDTFKKEDKSLGVLLSGGKGCGKTLTAKRVCIESDLPVIIITKAFEGELFYNFIARIEQEVIIFIDEFEKIFDSNEKQAMFLPILDGAFSSKKLFLFTSNSENLNEFLINRPNRIKYHIKYGGINKDTKEEIIADLLDNKDNKDNLLTLLDILGKTSIDVLINIIQAMNLYNETAEEVIKFLNIKVEEKNFNVLGFIDGKRLSTTINYNPLVAENIYISYRDSEDKYKWYSTERELFKISVEGEEFIFIDPEGNKLIFSRYTPYEFQL